MKMHYSHRLSSGRIAQIVGAFVLVPLLGLAIVGIFMAKSAHLFEEKFVLHTSLKNSYGLEPGAPVLMSGIPIGKVLTVEFTPEGTVDATVELLARYHGMVKEDSVATLTKSMLVAGATQVEISMGKGQRPLADGSFIKVQEPTDYLAMLQDLKGEYDREVKPVLESVQRTVLRVEEITKDVQGMVQTGHRMLATVERASRELPMLVESAQRTAVMIEKTAAGLPEITQNVKKTLTVVDVALGDVRKTTSKLPAIADSAQEAVNNIRATTEAVKGMTKEMPGIVQTAHTTLEDVSAIVRGAKKTFPVSAMVKKGELPAEAGPANGLLSLRGEAGLR
ncbi:MlaD family protein [Nitrospira sp. Kam-Ns4a]